MEEIELEKYELGDRIQSEEDLIWIFETYHKKIFSYINYRINDQSAAEDLTSQVFEKVIKNKHTYAGHKAPVEVWLFAIAKNTLNNYFREQKKRRWAPLEAVMEMISTKKTPEELTLQGEKSSKLKHSLNSLSERERNIVAMKFGGGLNNREIAEIMALSESNVGSILYRSMKKLRKEMEKEDVICLRNA